MAQLMSIAAFDIPEPAEKLAKALREAGFFAEVQDESGEQKWKLFNLHPRAQVRVVVPEERAEAATDYIKTAHRTTNCLDGAAICPECGSLRVDYPQFSRRTIMGALPAALAAAGVIERDYYCEACHHTWSPETPVQPDLDSLWWSRGKPLVKGL